MTKLPGQTNQKTTASARGLSGTVFGGSARVKRQQKGAMGRSDEFHWVTDAEPHSTRRREILAKHGDKVRKLYGYDHSTAVQVRRPL